VSPWYTPKLKKRTALLRKLKDVFRRYQSESMDRVVQLINPVLRGWVNYFAVGHSSECPFSVTLKTKTAISFWSGPSRSRSIRTNALALFAGKKAFDQERRHNL
jgi:RNA-directed DNA polymerase